MDSDIIQNALQELVTTEDVELLRQVYHILVQCSTSETTTGVPPIRYLMEPSEWPTWVFHAPPPPRRHVPIWWREVAIMFYMRIPDIVSPAALVSLSRPAEQMQNPYETVFCNFVFKLARENKW